MLAGPKGDRMLVDPDTSSYGESVHASKAPADVSVLVRGNQRMLRYAGQVDAETAPAESPPVGSLRIIDLPPGATAPVGIPESMTLYRTTPAVPVDKIRTPAN